MTDLHFLSVTEASGLMAAGKLSPVELVEAYAARIAAVDGKVRSYITPMLDSARTAAKRAETEIAAGRRLGPLHGIPFAVKDNYYSKGVRTTGASRLKLDWVPTENATAIDRLEAAGAILLGKLNTWEYGTGNAGVYHDLPFEVACNPWNVDHFTGGSSTGSGAAVAAGTAMAALGSDTGGSVRLPAAACGLAGMKPTYGRISRAGILPNCYSLDVPGPLCWTVSDAALMMQPIAGVDPKDPASSAMPVPDFSAGLNAGVKGLKIGVIRRFHEKDIPTDPDIAAGVEAAIALYRELGAEIVELDCPVSATSFGDVTRIVNSVESLSIHEQDFHERHALMGQALREKMMGGLLIRGVDYLRAIRQRRELAVMFDELIRGCDAVITAGACHTAPPYADQNKIVAFTRESTTGVCNVSGHPAMSICNGFDPAGLPLNMAVIGRYYDEATVFRVAAAYERATDWRSRRPTL